MEIEITVDGNPRIVREGELLSEVINSIQRLCPPEHHEQSDLCDLTTVSVNGKLQPACQTLTARNQEITTHSTEIDTFLIQKLENLQNQNPAINRTFDIQSLINSIRNRSGKILLGYGSVRGNARQHAQTIGNAFKIEPRNLSTVTLDDLNQATIGIFCVSTTGSGKYPRDMVRLVNQLPSNLSNLRFALVAFGSTYYKRTFCQAGSMFYDLLIKSGAQPILPPTKIDIATEDQGEPVFDSWLNRLRNELSG